MGAVFARLFCHFFKNVIITKFKLALGYMICRFVKDGIPTKKRKVIYDLICT